MTIDEAKEVAEVLKRFNDNEEKEWSIFDEYMVELEYLDDKQLVVESQILLERHQNGNARCTTQHPKEQCFVPVILRAVGYIVDDFQKTERLPVKSKYILKYYISFAQTGGIVLENY